MRKTIAVSIDTNTSETRENGWKKNCPRCVLSESLLHLSSAIVNNNGVWSTISIYLWINLLNKNPIFNFPLCDVRHGFFHFFRSSGFETSPIFSLHCCALSHRRKHPNPYPVTHGARRCTKPRITGTDWEQKCQITRPSH